jgi:hypothetical protein
MVKSILKEQIKQIIHEDVSFMLLEAYGKDIVQQLNDIVLQHNTKEYDINNIMHNQETVDAIKRNLQFYKNKLKVAIEVGNYRYEFEYSNKVKELEKKLETAMSGFDPFYMMRKIAEDNGLKELGHGSSRSAFELPVKSYVLKIAKNIKGIAQNEQEVSVYTNPSISNIVPRIYPKSDLQSYLFLIVEKVRPFKNTLEFEKIKKYPATFFVFIEDYGFNWKSEVLNKINKALASYEDISFEDMCNGNIPEGYEELYMRGMFSNLSITFREACNAFKDEEWLNEVASLMKKEKLLIGDLTHYGHLGVTSNGRVVILDTGYSEEVRKLY